MSWTWEEGKRVSRLDAAVLERMGRPAVGERNAKAEAAHMVLTAIANTVGPDGALRVAAKALTERKAEQPCSPEARKQKVRCYVDHLADLVGLSDSQYLSTQARAVALADHLPGLSPFLTAALAVDMEARRA